MRFFYWLAFYTARARFEWALGARDGYTPSRRKPNESIVTYLRGGEYVRAIKTHREIYGTSLKEAKDAVDALMVQLGIQR